MTSTALIPGAGPALQAPRAARLLLAVSVLACLGAGAEAQEYPRTVGDRVVLAALDVGDGGPRRYEVSMAACRDRACQVQVALVDGDRVVSRAATKWTSAWEPPRAAPATLGQGVGAPLEPPTGVTAWVTGEEAQQIVTTIRGVALKPGLNGVLVDQMGGFEHTKRRHELFAALRGKIVRLWQAEERGGPTHSSTAIVALGDGRDAVVLFDRSSSGRPGEPDRLTVTARAWDARAGAPTASRAARTSVHALLIGRFSTPATAREARAANPACLGAASVLPWKRFRGAPSRGYALVLPAASREAAERKREEIRGCAREDVTLHRMPDA